MTTSKGPAPARCDCIDKINSLLAPYNIRLLLMFNVFNERLPAEIPTMATQKNDTKKRGKPQTVIPSYCPFCGVRYATDEEDEDGTVNQEIE